MDVGCGIGGSSRYLARKYGAECKGITLSPVQAARAQSLAAAQGLGQKVFPFLLTSLSLSLSVITYLILKRLEKQVSFQVADALQQPFPDGEFDLVWSMESGEHMPDKVKVPSFKSPFLSQSMQRDFSLPLQ